MITTTVPNSATSHDNVIDARATAGLSRPLLDDFTFDRTGSGVTRSTGEIRDAAHLDGVMTRLASVGVELISATPVTRFNQPPTTTPPERNETS